MKNRHGQNGLENRHPDQADQTRDNVRIRTSDITHHVLDHVAKARAFEKKNQPNDQRDQKPRHQIHAQVGILFF